MKQAIFTLLGILLFTSCLKEDELKKPFVSFTPRLLNDGWQISSPTSENIDEMRLKEIFQDFHSDQDIWQVRSLLVFRNGKLLAESYTKDDADQYTPRAIWSATKQVVGLLTGIAIEKHLIHSVNDSISSYLPETNLHPDKRNIRIKDLLTMSSGIAFSNDGLSGQTAEILRQRPDKIVDFILGLPISGNPGEEVHYKDGDPQLVAAIIQEKCGTSTALWAKEVLFDKLEIKNLQWDNYKDGVTLGGFGILTTPRELAKFGQCVLDSGQWKGQSIVSKEWIEEMTSVRIQDLYNSQFGYLWWMDTERGITAMSGHGGQYVFIIPSKELIIVMTSEVNTQGNFQFQRELAYEWVDRIVDSAD